VKVAVDARHLAGGRGVAEYTRGMVAALAEASEEGDEIRLFAPGGGDVRGGGDAPAGVVLVGHRLPSRAIFGSAALLGRPRLDRLAGGQLDVVWAPAPAPLAVSADVPFVLTVHDLSWVERPGDFTPYERLWHAAGRLMRLAQRADRVVVDAWATIAPLVRWGVDPDRVRVVAPGVPERAATQLPPGVPERYVLFVGALEPRKDPELLLQANPGVDVVFAGSGRLAPKLTGPRIHLFADLSSGQLGALYANALALILPSRLEGFGFPPLEAALHGTPSIVTDLPVYAETVGDAAIRIPPGDADALRDAIASLASDDAARSELGAQAKERAERFTWASAGQGLRAVLEEATR
jgi:glycosyltransferase involved in cell wall biosynthesis